MNTKRETFAAKRTAVSNPARFMCASSFLDWYGVTRIRLALSIPKAAWIPP